MNKEGLVSALAEKFGFSKKQAAEAVEYVFSAIHDSLKKGEEVSISGFGSFVARVRKARTGVNPRTGAKIEIPEMKVPKFRAGKGLKDALRT